MRDSKKSPQKTGKNGAKLSLASCVTIILGTGNYFFQWVNKGNFEK